MRGTRATLLALAFWAVGIVADDNNPYQIDYNAKAAYFNYDNGAYVFSMNPTANGDIYMHMSAPKGPCWIGAGFGTEMKDALMFIAYSAEDGETLTVSPRIGTGHSEPVWDPSIEIFGTFNDSYAPHPMSVGDTGTMIYHGGCRNCTTWATGALDFENKHQPIIFALGPSCELKSDSMEASIPRHETYGHYTMDMTQAVNATGWYGRVPAPNIPDFEFPPTDAAFVSAWSSPEKDVVRHMGNPMSPTHAALMCIAFLVVFPGGSLALIFLKKVLIHAAMQVLGVILVIAGLGIGVNMSKQYNKSKNFNSAHQSIGLLIVAALLIQLSLGLIHHTYYVKTKNPTIFGKIHVFLGPSIMVFGLINAGLGFNFAGRSHLNIPYGIIAAIVSLVFFSVLGCLMCFKQRRKYRPESDGPVHHYPHMGEEPGVPAPYQDFELGPQVQFASAPPMPYEATTPYSPTFDSPYTPMSAYTPATPKTWRKEDVTSFAKSPYAVSAWEAKDFK